MNCSYCSSSRTKKNGHTHYGKQNHYCHDCRRQFVAGGSSWFVSDQEKATIQKLLLERISLHGICRVMNVSMSWLSGYISEVYASSPQDLNVVETLPDREAYLADRFDEEVVRLIKKR